jgi:hypothetical protein
MKVLLKLDGRTQVDGAPLVVHNERLADPLDEFTRAIQAIAKKRKKTEADHLEIGRLECLGSLYSDPAFENPKNVDGQLIGVPAWNILRCLQEGAKRHKRGVDVLRGVHPLEQFAQLDYQGPHDAEGIWREGFWLRKSVGVQRARTIRTRPMFEDWQLELPVEVDSRIFDVDTLGICWADAGRYAGLGEMRPVYGRFLGTLEVTEADPEPEPEAKRAK